ncbi:hypothetical protein [Microbacterium esteraromaticum]|uniref:hypothetical protein n=1 Tax=Microbacterium esteraromaticum TaxID=57043 RepID=UPI0019D38A74|nr:hypothetical protein [Microbacterium esteraromaticum]MBN7794001.1 hypothetical protein [Microbacterium esteraromaticum]
MADSPQVSPYGSARDLPSVQEMEQQLAAFKLLGILLPKEQRNKVKELEHEHRRITGLVDKFYGILGKRNWVFTGDLNLPAMEHVVDTDDAGTAETRLIGYYKEDSRIAFPLRRLHRFNAMRPRISLLQKALTDYEAGRYYSTVLVVLSVMDGFVNDLDTAARQGLHARPAEDMVAWDSVAGHHLGLSHAHQSFLKGFYKTDVTEVTELYRNGIMHGTLVNFDNEVVATKAWNRLFAVADWADSRERQAKPVEPTPTLREALRRWKDTQDQKTRIEEWQPYEYEPAPAAEPSEVAQTARDFLESWEKRRWGPVGAHFMELGSARSSVGKLAVLAKDLYGALELSEWTILRVRHVAAAVAHTDVELLVSGTKYRTDLRWVRVDHTGSTATEWESGHWALSQYGPSLFLKPETAVIEPDNDR